MFITPAFAQEKIAPALATLPPPPSTGALIMQNVMMVLIMVALFYTLFIVPQRRRAREHAQMLSALKKGDKVIAGGGLVGVIDRIVNDDEMVVDLGNGLKVTALRSTVHAPASAPSAKPANDEKKRL